MLSAENFFEGDVSVRYGVRRYDLSSLGLSCTTLWLFSDPQRTAVSQKYVRRDSLSTKCASFFL